MLEGLGGIFAACVGYRQAGAVKRPHTGDLLLGIPDHPRVNRLLAFENCVNAFGQHNRLPLEAEDERRILPIEHDHVDLIAEGALAFDHMRGKDPP